MHMPEAYISNMLNGDAIGGVDVAMMITGTRKNRPGTNGGRLGNSLTWRGRSPMIDGISQV
jgi:hypothetical protein